MGVFDDSTKLGTGKEKVDRLTKLIGIFENPELNFLRNRAEGDDILGDVYLITLGVLSIIVYIWSTMRVLL